MSINNHHTRLAKTSSLSVTLLLFTCISQANAFYITGAVNTKPSLVVAESDESHSESSVLKEPGDSQRGYLSLGVGHSIDFNESTSAFIEASTPLDYIDKFRDDVDNVIYSNLDSTQFTLGGCYMSGMVDTCLIAHMFLDDIVIINDNTDTIAIPGTQIGFGQGFHVTDHASLGWRFTFATEQTVLEDIEMEIAPQGNISIAYKF